MEGRSLGTIGGLIAAVLWLWAWWSAWRHAVDHGWPARGEPLRVLGRGMPLTCCLLVGLVFGVCGGLDGLFRVLVAPSARWAKYSFDTRGNGAVRDVLMPDLARAGIIVLGVLVSAFILRRAAIALVRDRLTVRTCARCSYLLGGLDKCPECGQTEGDGAAARPPTRSFRRLWLRTLLIACMATVLLGVAAGAVSLVRAYGASAPGEAFTVRVPMGTEFELSGPYGEVVITLSLGDDRSVRAVASWKGHGERRVVVPRPASGMSIAGAARLFSPPADEILLTVVYGDPDTRQWPQEAGYCAVWVPGSTEHAAPAAGTKPRATR